MNTTFTFSTVGRIIFGSRSRFSLGSEIMQYGKKPFLVSGSNPDRVQWLIHDLKQPDIPFEIGSVTGEPTIATVEGLVEMARLAHCDCVVAIGGGSVIDAGKAVAALLTNKQPITQYLEVIGEGLPLMQKPVPCVAVPTTSGTGSEVTRNAVLCSPDHRVKVSMRDYSMLPDLVLIDPELTLTLPPGITASTGLDALTQLIEAFITNKANAMTDSICREGIIRAGRSLKTACFEPDDLDARENMAIASLFSGIALANAGLGAVHGFAGPLGGLFPIPHGIICANLLPHVMAMNFRALCDRDPDNERLPRFNEIATLLTGDTGATSEDGINWITDLVDQLPLPTMSDYGIVEEDISLIVSKSQNSSSMKGNPVILTTAELVKILRRVVF